MASSSNGAKSKPTKRNATNTSAQVPEKKPVFDLALREKRLMRALQEIETSQHSQSDPVFTVELDNDSLFEWNLHIFKVDPTSQIAADMKQHNIPNIMLNMTFPENFPFAPPFVRVVKPQIVGGYVSTTSGAICMELLTQDGWSSIYTIEAIVQSFIALLVRGQGRITGAEPRYSKESAARTFEMMESTHKHLGWSGGKES